MLFSNDPVVNYKAVSIFQDQNLVLENINFTIEKGEMVYLVGKTGSGKSTLLKSIYADIPVDHGKALAAGFELNGLRTKMVPKLRRKLGIIFQDFQLFFDRSVSENLEFVLKATGWKDKAKIKTRIAEVLMQVGLGTAGYRYPHQLSGGEQQRVVIARALLNEPILLIADEPTGNLDPEVSRSILQIFMQINNRGTAILMATHNHYLIKDFPKRIISCANKKISEVAFEQISKPGQFFL